MHCYVCGRLLDPAIRLPIHLERTKHVCQSCLHDVLEEIEALSPVPDLLAQALNEARDRQIRSGET